MKVSTQVLSQLVVGSEELVQVTVTADTAIVPAGTRIYLNASAEDLATPARGDFLPLSPIGYVEVQTDIPKGRSRKFGLSFTPEQAGMYRIITDQGNPTPVDDLDADKVLVYSAASCLVPTLRFAEGSATLRGPLDFDVTSGLGDAAAQGVEVTVYIRDHGIKGPDGVVRFLNRETGEMLPPEQVPWRQVTSQYIGTIEPKQTVRLSLDIGADIGFYTDVECRITCPNALSQNSLGASTRFTKTFAA